MCVCVHIQIQLTMYSNLNCTKIHLASDLWDLNCSLSWDMSVPNGLQMFLSSHIYHIKPLSFSSTTQFMFNNQ